MASSSSDKPILTIALPSSSGLPKQIAWHRRGDYLATVCKYTLYLPQLQVIKFPFLAGGEGQGGVWIHQISRRHSQAPFKKIKGAVQLVLFHPTKPNFFVAVCDLRYLYRTLPVFTLFPLPFSRLRDTFVSTTWLSRNFSRHFNLVFDGSLRWTSTL